MNRTAILFLGLGAVGLLGCGNTSLASICDSAKDECNLTDTQVEDCRRYSEVAEAAVDGTPCEDEYHSYVNCAAEIDVADLCTANAEEVFLAHCAEEGIALNNCVEAQ